MTGTLLTVNVGSSSLRVALFDATDLAVRLRGHVDFGRDPPRVTLDGPLAGHVGSFEANRDDNGETINHLIGALADALPQAALLGVSHRIVHSGTAEPRPQRLQDDLVDALQRWSALAIPHQAAALQVVRSVSRRWPQLPQVACFDTAFHASQPELARMYALPSTYFDAGYRGYGFHGLACESIAEQLPTLAGPVADGKVIIVHLGSGSSLCALWQRRSVASSMGFSVLGGVPMSTRCGDLDPGMVLQLVRDHHLDLGEIEDLLYRRSGLLGVSGISGDIRVLESSADAGARQALDLLVDRVSTEMGAMAARLGGADAVVFSGGAGTGSVGLRARIAQRCAWLGMRLDDAANLRGEACISAPDSRVRVFVVQVDEERMLARAARGVLV
ncbi:MAG: acetate kinase [Rhodanobacteraceae bacterium]